MGSLCLKCPWASPSTLYGDTAFPSFNFFLELTTYLKYSPLNFTKEPFLQHYSPFTYKILHTLYEINAQLISLLLVFHYIYLSSIRAFFSFSVCFLIVPSHARIGYSVLLSAEGTQINVNHILPSSAHSPPKAFYSSWNEIQIRPHIRRPLTTTLSSPPTTLPSPHSPLPSYTGLCSSWTMTNTVSP